MRTRIKTGALERKLVKQLVEEKGFTRDSLVSTNKGPCGGITGFFAYLGSIYSVCRCVHIDFARFYIENSTSRQHSTRTNTDQQTPIYR